MKDRDLPKRQYTEEFKIEATRLAQSVGSREAARRLGIPVATLGNWQRRAAAKPGNADQMLGAGTVRMVRRPVSELEAENSRLRRELADARLDVEILRKTTAYFARGSR